jgi:copper chaperone
MGQTLNLAIEGMHCGACVRRVSAALDALVGAKAESVDVGSARLTFDPSQTTREQIDAAVDRIGFRVTAASVVEE